MDLFALVKRKNKYKIIDCSEINMFDMNWRSLGDLSSISGIQYHNNNGSLKSCLLIAISDYVLEKWKNHWQELNVKKFTTSDPQQLRNHFALMIDRDTRIHYKKNDHNIESYQVTNGCVFIFDNIIFKNKKLNRPPYTQEDTKHLTEAFSKIGFNVDEPFNNLSKDDIFCTLENISSEINCKDLKPNPLVVIFLTHGKESLIRGTDKDENSAYIFLTQIMEIFSDTKCEPLQDIPKIFILIACRGGEKDRGVLYRPLAEVLSNKKEVMDFGNNSDYSNFFISYSTIFGHASIRNAVVGTWFGQELSSVIKSEADQHDFEFILKLTQRKVAEKWADLEIRNTETNQTQKIFVKQSISWFAHNISKKLYLTQKAMNEPNAISKHDEENVFQIDTTEKKRYCFIFNNYDFDVDKVKDDNENGSHKDATIYRKTFEQLGFEVRSYPETRDGPKPTVETLEKALEEMKSNPCSAFFAIFLSHGNEREVRFYDKSIKIMDIVKKISNKECNQNLVGLPKILITSPIFEGISEGFVKEEEVVKDNELSVSGTDNITVGEVEVTSIVDPNRLIPTFSDIIICYSIISGKDTNSPIYGSFYSKVFSEMILQYHDKYHFEDILKLVHKKLIRGEGTLSDGKTVKQSTAWEAKGLIKILYL